jgi:hypothetical protein
MTTARYHIHRCGARTPYPRAFACHLPAAEASPLQHLSQRWPWAPPRASRSAYAARGATGRCDGTLLRGCGGPHWLATCCMILALTAGGTWKDWRAGAVLGLYAAGPGALKAASRSATSRLPGEVLLKAMMVPLPGSMATRLAATSYWPGPRPAESCLSWRGLRQQSREQLVPSAGSCSSRLCEVMMRGGWCLGAWLAGHYWHSTADNLRHDVIIELRYSRLAELAVVA